MMVEIRGVSCINKGAELMMHAILQKLRESSTRMSFTMVPHVLGLPWDMVASVGAYPKLSYPELSFTRFGIPGDALGACIPQRLRMRYGLIVDHELDVVLDASGFCYGDQWGARGSATMARAVTRWKRRGVGVILMPQALGPFSTRATRRAFKSIAERADLIYARDKESYGHVTSLVGEHGHIRTAPDFTVLVKGRVPPYWHPDAPPVCVVPNYRMIDKTSGDTATKYVGLLGRCVQLLKEMGQPTIFLIHEGSQDRELAKSVCEEAELDLPIIVEEDVFHVKGILGACKAVVGSRYHALIGGLSQGVPCLGTGWSHKYTELFQYYGCPEALLPVDVADKELRERLSRVLEGSSRAGIVDTLQVKASEHCASTERMWIDVLATLQRYASS